MRRRVADELLAPTIGDPSPDKGFTVDEVRFVQAAPGAANPNTLVIRITPWLRGAQGQHVSLQRSYRLTLALRPYLLYPQPVLSGVGGAGVGR